MSLGLVVLEKKLFTRTRTRTPTPQSDDIKIRKFKMAAIFGKLELLLCRDTLWVKNFVKFTLSSTFFEIEAFLCFAIFAKNLKIQNGRHFGRDKYFLKIGMATLQIYPAGQKFCRNRSI